MKPTVLARTDFENLIKPAVLDVATLSKDPRLGGVDVKKADLDGDGKISGAKEALALFNVLDKMDTDKSAASLELIGGDGKETAMKPRVDALTALAKASIANPTDRLLQGDNDKDHVASSSRSIAFFVQNGTYYNTVANWTSSALDSLAKTRDPAAKTWVPTATTIADYGGYPTNGWQNAAKGLAAGFTRKEFNVVMSSLIKTNPGRYDAVVRRALANPALLERIAKDGDQKLKEDVAVKILATTATPDQKLEALRKLTATPKGGADANTLTLDQVIKASPSWVARQAALDPRFAEMVAKQAKPESQLSIAQAVMRDAGVTPQARTDGLRAILTSTGKEGLNHLVSKATAAEAGALAVVIAGSTALQERMAANLSGPERNKLVEATLRTPYLSAAQVGRSLHVVFANLKPDAKNKLVDFLQKEDLLPDLIQSQTFMPIQNGLLPGLNAENAAAIAEGYWKKGIEARDDPKVANPNLLGRSASVTRSSGYSESSSRTNGTDTTVGGSIGLSKGPLEVSISGSTTSSSSRTVGSDRRSDTAYADTTERDALMKYESDVGNWQARNSYWRKTTHIDNWAQDVSPAFSDRYKKMKEQMHRHQ